MLLVVVVVMWMSWQVRAVVVVVVVGMVKWGSVMHVGGVGGHLVMVGAGERRRHAHAHRSAVRAELPRHAWQTSPFSLRFALHDGGLHVVPLPIHAHIHPHSTHRPSRSDSHVLLTVQHEAAHWLALWTVRCSLAHCSI